MEVAVIGSGLMGSGIAACISAGGPHHVHMFDTSSEALKTGVENAINQREFLRENHVPPTAVPGEIYAAESIESAVKNADFVFEAVLEDTGVKQSVFKQIENACKKEHFVMCTNTSSLSVTEIASKLDKPGRLLAAHFIGPAYLVPLVEVCPGQKTDGDAVEKVEKFLKSCGKKPAVMNKEIDGFVCARLQAALYRECLHLVKLGVASPETIDSVVYNGFGRRFNTIGPFQQNDFAGLDLVEDTHARFFPQLGKDTHDDRSERLVAEGRLGVKNGKGNYDWSDADIKRIGGARDAELLRRLKFDFDNDDNN
ncbi:3-hydroxyacyl-CoA dehyrogenase, putative [Perkinsus marinus ATCC 50983]|uniref:3-hydroxyacyl-CoA dehyrogenase, putative n=1 Tax=Perkinsus marinus (strain ATCC 50983 / TXsc) TaxID=423536 RepID=C5KPK6_PERM5|nr:3-hydroxyacyl-CoA dehyrogenase, putative [Perkinsus marinus ATCC 50983]EER13582.1 3-hydroxyacyl-CoA dehyrogenase, putative [Perkinsus marinus ATCC 50983]|eukprot:XP_002781787.1 3-hydroxyacyl-CoA dehyrogenase, putative [Perkinsus marinus ATCC 50983]